MRAGFATAAIAAILSVSAPAGAATITLGGTLDFLSFSGPDAVTIYHDVGLTLPDTWSLTMTFDDPGGPYWYASSWSLQVGGLTFDSTTETTTFAEARKLGGDVAFSLGFTRDFAPGLAGDEVAGFGIQFFAPPDGLTITSDPAFFLSAPQTGGFSVIHGSGRDRSRTGYSATNPITFASIDGEFLRGPGHISVPEPGTWALMIGGFGLAGTALRRRRATA